MTKLNPILNSVHTSNDSLQRRRVLLSVVIIIECDSRGHDVMTELTPILNSVQKNDCLQRRRVPLSVVTSIESDFS
jgi:hypothetical protein